MEEMGSTLNIFNEHPLRMKMSFSGSGHYHFEPNCVYEKDGFYCFEINDEKYRMVFHLRFDDGKLSGYYTQFHKQFPIRYCLVSPQPEDAPYSFRSPYVYVPESDETRIALLKRYADYAAGTGKAYETKYVLGGRTPSILKKYNFTSCLQGVDPASDDIAFRLLDFVCDHFRHDGSSGMPRSRKIKDIIAYCEEHEGKINCRGLSILLASLLRLRGIKARHITCMPYEDPFNDCHVVVDCLLPSGKRIMLDPTYRLYLTDEKENYVSLANLRKMLLAGAPFFPNEKASYNGGDFDRADYREYMTKNTFRFSRGTCYQDGAEENTVRRIELIPAGYPTEKFSDSAKSEFIHDSAAFWQM